MDDDAGWWPPILPSLPLCLPVEIDKRPTINTSFSFPPSSRRLISPVQSSPFPPLYSFRNTNKYNSSSPDAHVAPQSNRVSLSPPALPQDHILLTCIILIIRLPVLLLFFQLWPLQKSKPCSEVTRCVPQKQ